MLPAASRVKQVALTKLRSIYLPHPQPDDTGADDPQPQPDDTGAGDPQPQPDDAAGAHPPPQALPLIAPPQPEDAGTDTGTVTVCGTILQTVTATSSVTV